MLKKLNPSENEVVTLTPAEHQAFVEAVKPVTEKIRKELGGGVVWVIENLTYKLTGSTLEGAPKERRTGRR